MRDKSGSDDHCGEEACSKTEEFVGLYSTHSSRIAAFVRTLMVDPNDSEDVLQSTSIILWRKFGTYDPDTNFMYWACRIAYLEACNHRRVQRRRPVFNGDVFERVASEAIDMLPENDWRQGALSDCVKKLEPSQQELLRLRYQEDLKPKAIAERVGLSVHKIYRRLTSIHGRLLCCIESSANG